MTLRPRKEGRRQYWTVDLGIVDGRRRRKNFRREAAARTFMIAARKERELHGRRAFDLSQEERVEFLRARQELAAAGASIGQAVQFFLERRPRGELTLSRAISECVVAKRASGRRPRYLQQFENVLESFGAGRGERIVSKIEPREIEAFLNGNGWAAATRRSYLIDLRTLFSWCVRRGVVIENPAEQVERVLLEDKAPGILSVDQARALFRAALESDRNLIGYLALGLLCGIRPEEIRRLTWDDVDLRRGHVEIAGHRAKSRRRRLVTIARTARLWLQVKGIKTGINHTRFASIVPKNFRKRWIALREAAGFSLSISAASREGVKLDIWPADGLRHSFASYHLAAHQSQDLTAHELGHGSTAMLFAHYRALVTPAAARQFWAITPASLEAAPAEAKVIPIRSTGTQG